MSPIDKAHILSEALPYIRAYHGKTVVIRFGGNAMTDDALKAGFARDVALLRLIGVRLVIVHGGGWHIDELLRKMGIEVRRHGRIRITDERTLTVIEMALGEINQELTGLVNRHGGRAIGLNGQDGRFIHARALGLADGTDVGFVGDVESIDTALIELLLSRNFTPVVMPIGVGADGAAYHINSDLLASSIARALKAQTLVLMTNTRGVQNRDGELAYILAESEAAALLDEGLVAGGMRPRLEAALQAVREGVQSVHIIDGGVPDALLLEVLTNEGVGTAIRSDAGHFLEESRAYLLAAP